MSERLTARTLWEFVAGLIADTPEAFRIVDDNVQDKRCSRFMELVKRRYRGAARGLARGIGLVNLAPSAGAEGDVYPMDYRRHAPEQDGKTKKDQFADMAIHAVYAKNTQAKRILLDSGYASAQNWKLVHRLGFVFFTTRKSNRMVRLSKEGGWIHLDEIDWTAERLENGVMAKLKEVPFPMRLFPVVAADGNMDWAITHCPDETLTAQAAQEASDVRWQVEERPRGLKQWSGMETCRCRKGRSQRNHMACGCHAWLALKVKAKAFGKTLYPTKHDLLSDYLRAEVRQPRIPTFMLA